MNIVNQQPPIAEQGDIFVKDGEYYIIAFPQTGSGEKYASISLKDGHTYNGPCNTPESAAKNLTFYKRGANITII